MHKTTHIYAISYMRRISFAFALLVSIFSVVASSSVPPTSQPSVQPSSEPSCQPSCQPSMQPSVSYHY